MRLVHVQHTEARPIGRPVDQAKDLAILDAARRLLFREGPRAFTVEAVAHVAGVSKVTIYARHGSREGLVHAVIGQLAQELSMAFDQHPGDSTALRASLIEFGRRLLTFIVSPAHVGQMRSLLGSGASSAPALRRVFQRGPAAMLQRVSAWLAGCHREGSLHCPLPERSAETLLGMLQGLTLVRAMYGAVNAESKRDIEAHVSFAVDAFLRAHQVEPPRPSASRTAAPAGRT
jgi:TetR/AcrR family transcriptional repressor of mexJK operon